MVMMKVKLLVKIAVMMMAPGGTLVPPGERGREPPFFFFFLDLPLDGRRVSPLVLGLHGMGGARAPPRLDLSLCLSLFYIPRFCPFTVLLYPEIRNSDWVETFAVIFLPKISFFAAEEGHQPP